MNPLVKRHEKLEKKIEDLKKQKTQDKDFKPSKTLLPKTNKVQSDNHIFLSQVNHNLDPNNTNQSQTQVS